MIGSPAPMWEKGGIYKEEIQQMAHFPRCPLRNNSGYYYLYPILCRTMRTYRSEELDNLTLSPERHSPRKYTLQIYLSKLLAGKGAALHSSHCVLFTRGESSETAIILIFLYFSTLGS